MQVQPYLFFHGRCEEAVEFYRTALGAEAIELLRFRDAPWSRPRPVSSSPGTRTRSCTATFRRATARVLVSDGARDSPTGFQGFSLAIMVPTEAEADRVFAALADGGQVGMPLGRTFWSARFGTVTDRFGVSWMVNAVPTEPPTSEGSASQEDSFRSRSTRTVVPGSQPSWTSSVVAWPRWWVW